MKKTSFLKVMVCIMTIIAMFVGSVKLLQSSVKVIATAAELLVIRDNVQFYNEQSRKTDAMTAEYHENETRRQGLYNSADNVVRNFSRGNILVKLFTLVGALLTFIMIPYMWFCHIIRALAKAKRRAKTTTRDPRSV